MLTPTRTPADTAGRSLQHRPAAATPAWFTRAARADRGFLAAGAAPAAGTALAVGTLLVVAIVLAIGALLTAPPAGADPDPLATARTLGWRPLPREVAERFVAPPSQPLRPWPASPPREARGAGTPAGPAGRLRP